MRPPPPNHVLFLCTGNFLAGRCAEVLFESAAAKVGLPWTATARCLTAQDEFCKTGRMSPATLTAVRNVGLPVTEEMKHAPDPVSAVDFEQACRIVALNRVTHRFLLEERFPVHAQRAEYWEIDDSPQALLPLVLQIMGLVARLVDERERRGCRLSDVVGRESGLPSTGIRPMVY